jgi:hypothetical protein
MAAAKKPRRPKASKQSAARKRAAQDVSLADALARAAWVEADAALAQALIDFDHVGDAADAAARRDALDLLAQSLSRAARKRGLARIGALGGVETYDPRRHELSAPVAKAPKKVRIEARGVARGDLVLARPRVGPVQRKKRP